MEKKERYQQFSDEKSALSVAMVELFTNSGDHDQMPHALCFAMSHDLGLHVC